jgi:hypothetical protein
MGTAYQNDILVWAREQAALLRSGQLSAIDIEHIAEEILDVGKSEQRELENRMAVLLAHLLKWQFQPERQSSSWKRTIREQRKSILIRLKKTPSLRGDLNDSDWWISAWADAVSKTIDETGIGNLPESCPWSIDDILTEDWLPI